MVGERGFEPPTPWSRTSNRFTKLLFRLGLFCVLYRLSVGYSGTNGPNLDPNEWVSGRICVRGRAAYRIPVPQKTKTVALAIKRVLRLSSSNDKGVLLTPLPSAPESDRSLGHCLIVAVQRNPGIQPMNGTSVYGIESRTVFGMHGRAWNAVGSSGNFDSDPQIEAVSLATNDLSL